MVKKLKMAYKAKFVYREIKVAKKYDKRRFHSIKGIIVDIMEKTLIYRAVKKTGLLPPAKILDVPCGTGRLSIYLAEKGFRVTGIDISKAMINQAKKKLEQELLKQSILLQVEDAESLSFPDSYFNIVISLRLFGHLPDKKRIKILKEFCRVSNKYVITTYYKKNSIQEILRRRKRALIASIWNPVSLNQIDEDLAKVHLVRIASYYILPLISETVVVLSKKI